MPETSVYWQGICPTLNRNDIFRSVETVWFGGIWYMMAIKISNTLCHSAESRMSRPFYCVTITISNPLYQMSWSSAMLGNVSFVTSLLHCIEGACSRSIYFSESVNFFPTYIIKFLPYFMHNFYFALCISFPISILAELFPYPKSRDIARIYTPGM